MYIRIDLRIVGNCISLPLHLTWKAFSPVLPSQEGMLGICGASPFDQTTHGGSEPPIQELSSKSPAQTPAKRFCE